MIAMRSSLSRFAAACGFVAIVGAAAPALAQGEDTGGSQRLEQFGEDMRQFRDRVFGQRPSSPPQMEVAQVSAADLLVRIDRLENQIRSLNGTVEQLQFRNRELETQLRRFQEDVEFRFQERAGAPRANQPRPPAANQAPGQPAPAGQPQGQPRPQQRGDAFDPTQTPGAPGAPRTLGQTSTPGPDAPLGAPIGAPGGREAGQPLDLGTLAGRAAADPTLAPPPPSGGAGGSGMLPPPPQRNTSATGAGAAPGAAVQPVAAPTDTPRDAYDLAYGAILRQDYSLAETQFRDYLRRFPNDRQVGDAQFWLGESLYQRQRFKDAAESFLTVTTRHDRASKAPDAMLRLGQSLVALGEREAACATFGEIGRKYPNASQTVRSGTQREMTRARCAG
jgi:tol-pal system protein YbgF